MSQSAREKELFRAVRLNNVTEVKALLDAGCPADIYDQEGDSALTPLHCAVGKNPLIATLLLAAGARANAADDSGFTPLMQAIAEKDYALARTLVANGGEINWCEGQGKITALHAAVFASNRDDDMERLRFVLALGADQALAMRWQGHEALTARALAVLLQSEAGDIVGVLDHPERPVRRLVHTARAVFRHGMAERAQDDKKRFTLK